MPGQFEDTRPTQFIDCDIHNGANETNSVEEYLPRAWRELYRGAARANNPYSSPIGVTRQDASTPEGKTAGSDPAYLIEHHLDAYDIDYGILTGSGVLSLSLHPDPDFGNVTASAFNDWTREQWLDFSPRFRGSIFINHSDPLAAAKEIDRMASDKRFVQVIMASGSRNLFGQRQYHPIYEAAERNGLPVAVHPGTESAGLAGPPTPSGYPTRYMEWHNILPTNYMAHVNSLVCEGVFEKFPKLKFVAIEGGIAWLPHLMWRMDKNYKGLRMSTPWLKKLPSEYILEHIRLTTQPIEESPDPKHIAQIFEMVQAEKTVMFSSDYPHWDFDNPRMALPPLPKAMKVRIMCGNAADLYNLHEAPARENSAAEKREAVTA
jgi:predicted TIM-barrel fold metal-dependent hydrolase